MGKRRVKLITIVLFGLISLTLAKANAIADDFGWEDGTTQGWIGNVSNSGTYYYNGRHSLALNLNLKGEGFKSTQTSLAAYDGKPGDSLGFKVYLPSTPEVPLDFKGQVYIGDSQGNITRNRWSFLLSDRWNDLFFTIPADFKGPFTVALSFGTQFQYEGRIYIDQTQELPKLPGDTIPGCYNTYIPASAEETGFLPMALAPQSDQNRSLRRIGSFREPSSDTESTGEEETGEPLFFASSSTPTIPASTGTTITASSVNQSSGGNGGGGVIFEHKTFLLLSVGLFMFGLKFKK